jgi:hypothetical protein
MWMPHPIERVKRDAMAGTSGVLSVESLSTRYLPELRLSRVKHNASARRAREKTAKPKLCRFSQFLVALFRIFGKATGFRRSENRPSGPVEVALFRIKGKENYRGLRLERFSTERRFDEAPQVR